jgi:hypothetical protein
LYPLELGGIEINSVAGGVGEPLVFQFTNQPDLLSDSVGGFAPQTRRLNIEMREVFLERIGIVSGNIPSALALSLGALLQLILTHIPITGEMTDVSDVHDMLDPIAVICQHAFQDIFE